jgi:hypothetical protein
MTDKAVIDDQELEELDVAPEAPETEDETTEGENQAAPDDLEEELIVTIGEETPPQEEIDENSAPDWVRKVRANDREKTRKLRQTERELEETRQKLASYEQQKQTQLGPKPTLEACDYDADLFERRLDAWKERQAVANSKRKPGKPRRSYRNTLILSLRPTTHARKKSQPSIFATLTRWRKRSYTRLMIRSAAFYWHMQKTRHFCFMPLEKKSRFCKTLQRWKTLPSLYGPLHKWSEI